MSEGVICARVLKGAGLLLPPLVGVSRISNGWWHAKETIDRVTSEPRGPRWLRKNETLQSGYEIRREKP